MKSNTIDAVLFDVDGTLWDSTDVVAVAWNKALIDTGHTDISVDSKRLKGLFGLPMVDIFKDIIPNAGEEEFNKFEAVCNEYEEKLLENTPGFIYDKITEVIAEASKSKKLFIISNCQSGYIEIVMKHLKIEDYITDYTCPGDSGMLKAENIKMMCEKYKLTNPVYVGDTHMDELACEKAGVPIIFAAYGFGKVENPYAVIHSPEELLNVL